MTIDVVFNQPKSFYFVLPHNNVLTFTSDDVVITDGESGDIKCTLDNMLEAMTEGNEYALIGGEKDYSVDVFKPAGNAVIYIFGDMVAETMFSIVYDETDSLNIYLGIDLQVSNGSPNPEFASVTFENLMSLLPDLIKHLPYLNLITKIN